MESKTRMLHNFRHDWWISDLIWYSTMKFQTRVWKKTYATIASFFISDAIVENPVRGHCFWACESRLSMHTLKKRIKTWFKKTMNYRRELRNTCKISDWIAAETRRECESRLEISDVRLKIADVIPKCIWKIQIRFQNKSGISAILKLIADVIAKQTRCAKSYAIYLISLISRLPFCTKV